MKETEKKTSVKKHDETTTSKKVKRSSTKREEPKEKKKVNSSKSQTDKKKTKSKESEKKVSTPKRKKENIPLEVNEKEISFEVKEEPILEPKEEKKMVLNVPLESEKENEEKHESDFVEPIAISENKSKEPHFHTSEVLILILITCVVSMLMGSFITYSLLKDKNNYNHNEFSSEMNEFIEHYNYIKENYEDATEKQLLNGAIEGMLESVGDPYAGFIDPNSRLMQELNGSLYGIGVEIINNEEGNIEIYNVFENGPAGRGGLQKGDIINSVNGLDLTNQSTSVFSTYVQGNATDEFQIEYTRGDEKKEITLKKEYVIIPSVFSAIFEENGKKVGYLQVTIFSATTYEQFKNKLEELENENIDSLIIDVRNNSGGRLDAVADMLSLFLDSSHIIYQTDTNGVKEKYYSTGKVTKQYPIVVLTNGSSASASEVLASTLKEEYGASLVGTTTFGKGTVQQIKTLLNGDEYKLTTKKWLTPSGTCIDGVGIEPTRRVELNEEYFKNPSRETDNQLQEALKLLVK